MLETCLNYYGLYHDLKFSLSLHKLETLAFEQHHTGYQSSESPMLSLSYFDVKKMLNIYQETNYEHIIQEVFRYASYFGIIKDVVISPFHIEWRYNCFHQRDLFFAKLQLEIREQNKISSIF